MKYKLYVWEHVLCDYTCGLAAVYASSLDQALNIILTKAKSSEGGPWNELLTEITDSSIFLLDAEELENLTLEAIKEHLIDKPRIFSKPDGVIVAGGG